MYIGPEFQLGQVYDGSLGVEDGENVVLYRPVYVCVRRPHNHNFANRPQQSSNNELNCDPGPSKRM